MPSRKPSITTLSSAAVMSGAPANGRACEREPRERRGKCDRKAGGDVQCRQPGTATLEERYRIGAEGRERRVAAAQSDHQQILNRVRPVRLARHEHDEHTDEQ